MSRMMKDSGVVWIGEMPINWHIGRIKNYYVMKTGFTPDTSNDSYYDDDGYVWISISDLDNSKHVYDSKKKISQKFIDDKSPILIPKGSLLYSFKLSVGQVAFAGRDLYTNEAIASFLNTESTFLPYLYYSAQYFIGFNANVNIYGASLLNQDLIMNAWITQPPIVEQRSIAEFLDTKCSYIDRLIALQEEMITELQAYKQSVITEAVTKGLDPDVPMKDSGVEWIGYIPVDAKVVTVARFYRSKLGKMVCDKPTNDDDTLEPYLCAINVHFDGIDLSTLKQMWFSSDEKQKYKLRNGDLLVVEGGAGSGGAAIIEIADIKNLYIQNSIHLVRANEGFALNKYLYYVLYSLVKRSYIDYVCNKATIPHFTQEKLMSTPIVSFSKNTQQEIVDYLDIKCRKIDKMISLKQSMIITLKEYKKSLIYECVTGKRDCGARGEEKDAGYTGKAV